MSLFLDARRKIQQAQSVPQDDAAAQISSAAAESADQARNAGQNLLAAKVPSRVAGHALPKRNLLYALGGTILLLALGAAYFWYLDFAGNTVPPRPASARPVQVAPPATPPATPVTQNAPGIAAADTIAQPQPSTRPPMNTPAVAAQAPSHAAHAADDGAASASSPVRIAQQNIEPVDPLLVDAYLAYRDGRLDEAQRLYRAMLDKDARNPDVLLGLASIALRRGENQAAAHYFGRVLALDPRNAAANAGMAALGADENFSESRLKILLREQGNAAVLHFSLGNLYAGQTRWGEAQQAYFNAYTLEQGNAEFAFNLAVSLDHLGQRRLAAQHYRRAMQLDAAHGAGFDHTQAALRAQDLER